MHTSGVGSGLWAGGHMWLRACGHGVAARTVLDDEAERPYARVELHVRVQEARLLHGKVVADGQVAPQPRRGMLQP